MRRPTWPLVAAVAALVVAAGSAAALLRQGRDLDEPIVSVALAGRVHARVILPASYDDRPFAGTPSSTSCTASRAAHPPTAATVGSPTLSAAPARRSSSSEGARDADTDPEYLDWGAGRNWQTYIARELPRSDPRTLPHHPLALRPCHRRRLGRRLRRYGRRPAPPRARSR